MGNDKELVVGRDRREIHNSSFREVIVAVMNCEGWIDPSLQGKRKDI